MPFAFDGGRVIHSAGRVVTSESSTVILSSSIVNVSSSGVGPPHVEMMSVPPDIAVSVSMFAEPSASIRVIGHGLLVGNSVSVRGSLMSMTSSAG